MLVEAISSIQLQQNESQSLGSVLGAQNILEIPKQKDERDNGNLRYSCAFLTIQCKTSV